MILHFLKRNSGLQCNNNVGIFEPVDGYEKCIILLDALKGRYDFPELKNVALEQYQYWEPETVIVEAKASGHPYP